MNLIAAMWDTLTLHNVQAVLPLFQGLSSLGVIVSIFIYIHQRRVTAKAESTQRASALAAEERQRAALRSSEQQANRSRLTEAYMNVHAYILQSEDNVKTAERLIRRGAGYVQFDREGEITRAIELLYLKLNSFFLEWNYRRTYDLPMEEFYKTFDNAMRGFATTTDHAFRPILNNFPDIFSDFPDEFLRIAVGRLGALRNRPIRPELNLQYMGGTATEGIDWFCAHIKENVEDLETIRNTIFHRYGSDPSHQITEEGLLRYSDSIRQALNNRCTVIDIFTEGQKAAEEDFFLSLSATQKSLYYSSMINVDIPMLQLLIMRHRSPRRSAVLFGWGFPEGKSANVYLSMGTETIDYFEDYFNQLLKPENSVRIRSPSPITVPRSGRR